MKKILLFLIPALIIIAVLVGVYVFISPYQNCIRNYEQIKLSQDSDDYYNSGNIDAKRGHLRKHAMRECKSYSW
jgi:hypothetical protein